MLKNGLICGGFLVFHKLIGGILVAGVMSALGQKQPLNNFEILSSEWPVLGYTGHSPLRISGDASGCFRPEAVVPIESRHAYSA